MSTQTTPSPLRKYGWKPSLPDHRDRWYDRHLAPGLKWGLKAIFPASHMLVPPPVYDQLSLGSCVENGVCGAAAYLTQCEGEMALLSRLQLYYGARGGIREDTGSTIRDAIKVFAAQGCGLESLWPYSDDPAVWQKMPPTSVYKEGLHRAAPDTGVQPVAGPSRRFQYGQIRYESMRHALNCGFPVVFGATVYGSFEATGLDGKVAMPGSTEEPLGGHCMTVYGYDDARSAFRVQNSWGPGWADGGRCWIPYGWWEDGYVFEQWVMMYVEK